MQNIEGAAGSLYITVELRNVTNQACILKGALRIVALTAQGKKIRAAVRWPVSEGDIQSGEHAVTVFPARSVRFIIHTLARTGFPASQVCADRLRVYLPRATPEVAAISAESCREIEVSGYQAVR